MSRLKVIAGSLADGGHVVDDAWTEVDTADSMRAASTVVPLLVTRLLWSAEREALLARGTPIGVRLEPDDDPASIAADLPHFGLVAIHFPKFTDGRGYSIARLLRERHGYAGPLRAVGDVLRDQLFYMLRCGFDEFGMKHQASMDEALGAYRDFSDVYQTAVDRRPPVFARRAAEAR